MYFLVDRTGASWASLQVLYVPLSLIMTPLAITPNMGKQEIKKKKKKSQYIYKNIYFPKLKIKNQ